MKQPIDLIVGGPPCQGFSIAGKRDTNDPRNSLFMEYVKYILLQTKNISYGILSMKTENGEKVIDIIPSELIVSYQNFMQVISKFPK